MRTKIFLTTLLLFVGFISNAQKETKSSNSKTQKKEGSTETNTPTSSNFSDSEDIYKGNTKLVNVTTDVYFLKGNEENMGVFLAKEGVILIDTQNPEEMSRSLKIINRLNKKLPIKYIINTSSKIKNKKNTSELKKDGTLLIAKNNSSANKSVKKGSNSTNFKPSISFKGQMAFNFENEKLEIISIKNTENSAVYLSKKNVLFTGPIFVNKKYPLIDADTGNGYKVIINGLSSISNIANDKTKIIPGKGEIASLNDVNNANKMMENVVKQVYSQRANGKTLEQVLVMKNITKNYDARGYGEGTVTTEMFITSIYNEIAKELGPIDTRTPEEKAMARLKEIQKDNKKDKSGKN